LLSLRIALVSCLLVSMFIPLLATPTLVGGNDLTTLTSVETITTSYSESSASTSLIPIQYLGYPYDYHGSTGSFHLTNERILPAKTFGMPEYDTIVCWYFDYFIFRGVKAQEVRGQIASSPYSVRFHIMTMKQFDYWDNDQYAECQPRWPSLFNASGSSYSLDWIVPQDGDYVFLFSSRVNGGLVHFEAYVFSNSTVSYTASSTLTQATTFTSTETNLITSNLTGTNPYSTQSSPAVTSQTILLATVGIIFVAALVWVAYRRRNK
jgi:hypothetical protein